jgi:hypothetical protein
MTINNANNSNSLPLQNDGEWRSKLLVGVALGATVVFSGMLLRHSIVPEANCDMFQRISGIFRQIPKNEDVKLQHSTQLRKFRHWANTGSWRKFDTHHYDWWIFPITQSSDSYGVRFALSPSDIESLKQDPDFMDDYRQGVHLVSKSWGWDLSASKPISDRFGVQKWTGHGVRLGKMADSLQLFGEKGMFRSLQQFSKQHQVQSSIAPWVKNTLK